MSKKKKIILAVVIVAAVAAVAVGFFLKDRLGNSMQLMWSRYSP